MNREQAKLELLSKEPIFLEVAKKKVNGFQTFICPKCGNGSGNNGDGIALVPKDLNHKHYKCMKCGLHEDVIGLWKIHANINSDREAFNGIYNYFNINPDTSNGRQQQPEKTVNIDPKTSEKSYFDFIKKAHGYIANTRYPALRGIGQEVVNRFYIGFCANHLGADRLIIPTSKYSYIARDTNEAGEKSNRYRKVGKVHFFNIKSLARSKEPVFIVEGEIDAMSIIEVGKEAVALGSTANTVSFLEEIRKIKKVPALILALDKDYAGSRAQQDLANILLENNVPYVISSENLYLGAKDANEALMKSRIDFKANIEQELTNAKKELYKDYFNKTCAANFINSFMKGIADSVNTSVTPTNFKKLDSLLDGGLYEGLYAIGAIPSLGKTTLVMQLADQIAQQGKDVLIFSLEMARAELMAKSISRHTIQEALEGGIDPSNAKTARGITDGKRYVNYNKTEKDLIYQAIKDYAEYSSHVFISEGLGNIGTNEVKAQIKEHIKATGNVPIVVIDYLQILAPYNPKSSDKQNTDMAVMELKRISRDFKTPVLVISSLNRENYDKKISMLAFKESGAIEYSTDVLIGLQFKGAGTSSFNINDARKANPREIEAVILKNRNGRTGESFSFNYYPMFNYYQEQ